MRKLSILILVFCLVPVTIAQTLSGRFSSSVFNFERYDTARNATYYGRAYQQLQLKLGYQKYSLQTAMNYESDIDFQHANPSYFRVYNLYLEGRDLFDLATVRLGRIPIFNGIASGVYDGASLKLDYMQVRFDAAYGGILAPQHEFSFAKDMGDNYAMAFNLSTTMIRNVKFGIGYSKKNYKAEEYYAARLNSDFDVINTLIRRNSSQFEFLHAALDYMTDNSKAAVYTKYEYDLNLNKLSKFESDINLAATDKLQVNIYGNYREPRVRYNSIFSVFDYGSTWEGDLGATYHFDRLNSLSFRGGIVQFRDADSYQAGFTYNLQYGSIGYRRNFGNTGELETVNITAAYTFKDRQITPSAGLSLTSYKLSSADATENLSTVFAGVNFRPVSSLSFDLQGQYSSNRIYNDDVRLFFRLNYWFHTIL